MIRQTMTGFCDPHSDIEERLTEHYIQLASQIAIENDPTPSQQKLLAAYFTMEYAFESAALFNPSMALSWNQSDLPAGAVRFIMSLRAVGEGHVSSIVFRAGQIDSNGQVTVYPVSPSTKRMRLVEDRQYDKGIFTLKLIEMGAYHPAADLALERLPDHFTMHDLDLTIETVSQQPGCPADFDDVAASLCWLARSNYQIEWQDGDGFEELVLFPVSEAESQGMEDMRLVRFTEDDGSTCFYGTYTAFNGRQILPQLLEATELGKAEVHTLNGRYAQNKGIALFPRKLDGWYAMIARVDGENLYLAKSKNLHFWNEAAVIQEPKYPWQFVQIGNCGPPIETPEGWLLLTHGVGPMRRYSIGASLLDLENPEKVIGQLREPLLTPTDDERCGYVPNVVYSCGGMVHNGLLVIPYGMSDAATGFATVPLDDLLSHMSR